MTLARCGYSQLTIAFSAFMLYFNATLLACVVYFSSQLPFGISGSFIAYFAVASALCLLGLVGSLKVRASSQLDFLKSQRPTPCFDPLPHPYLTRVSSANETKASKNSQKIPTHNFSCVTLYRYHSALLTVTQRFEPFVSIFANHVLLDAVLLTIPRVAFLAFLSTLPTSICSASDFPNLFLPPTSPTLPGADTVHIHAYAGSYGGSAASSDVHFWSENRDQCFVVVNTLMGVAACLAVMTGVAQWCVALRVRKFAQALRRQSLVEKAVDGHEVVVVVVDEKMGLEKV
ncbi:hypothetical protein HDK90DRAFT_464989 [Phyllosticta capitalensis]|uniref:Uncharacterized protein n=1 Tax=Phyllosticta capitalensis TaxID=121624 RepID=A0ABR1YT66_9PEZI